MPLQLRGEAIVHPSTLTNGISGGTSTTSAPQGHVAVYGEVDMNLVDGSSIWLQSICSVLASVSGVDVTVLLRCPERRDLVTRLLRDAPNIRLVAPDELGLDSSRLNPSQALVALDRLDRERLFDLVLIRGGGALREALLQTAFPGRLWSYYLPSMELHPDEIRSMVLQSDRVICQTAAVRDHLLDVLPDAEARIVVLPPMVPFRAEQPVAGQGRTDPGRPPSDPSPVPPWQRLVYAGKIEPRYLFIESVRLLERLRAQGLALEMHVLGDLVRNPPDDPGFAPAARRALEGTEGLIWHGAIDRAQVHEFLRRGAIGLGLREPSVAASPELSTKLLEYGAAGCPVLLNRTDEHERLLGEDYPLFADDPDEAGRIIRDLAEDPGRFDEAARRCHAVSEQFTFERARTRIGVRLPAKLQTEAAHVRLGIAGHDLKFLGDIPAVAAPDPEHRREDIWEGHSSHDVKASRELVNWADVIFCEWALGNAVWYSRNVHAHQRLVVRFHRQELETDYPADIDMSAVSRVVFVSRHILEGAIDRFGWPRSKLSVIPNAVDVDRLLLPKSEEPQFTLAMIGWVPKRKRLDLALDLLRELRRHAPRYRLLLKGKEPEAFPWVMRREDEAAYFAEQRDRIKTDPLLSDGVEFLPFGDDVPELFARAGFVVSVSDSEGHQVGLAEGAASGSIPVILERGGVHDQYPARWIHDSAASAAESVRNLAEAGLWESESEAATRHARRWTWEQIAPEWQRVLGVQA